MVLLKRSSLFLALCFNLFPPFYPIWSHFPPFPPISPRFSCFPIFLRVHYRVDYVPPWPGDSPPWRRSTGTTPHQRMDSHPPYTECQGERPINHAAQQGLARNVAKPRYAQG